MDLDYAQAKVSNLTYTGQRLAGVTVIETTKSELTRARAEVARLEELLSLLEAHPEIERVLTLMSRCT